MDKYTSRYVGDDPRNSETLLDPGLLQACGVELGIRSCSGWFRAGRGTRYDAWRRDFGKLGSHPTKVNIIM